MAGHYGNFGGQRRGGNYSGARKRYDTGRRKWEL